MSSVLIVDDDPGHLRIYGWIVEAAGYRALPVPACADGLRLPEEPVDMALLDYHLIGSMSAVEAATQIRGRFPEAPIVLLSDALVLPEDIAPFVQGFVRKGNPAVLVETLHRLLKPTP